MQPWKLPKPLRRRLKKVRRKRRFQREFEEFASRDERFDVRWEDRWMIYQRSGTTNSYSPEYLYHMAWAARVLQRTRPAKHVDIASWVYFVSLVSAFVPIDFYEFQPTPLTLSDLSSGRADLTQLDFADDSIESLSCMHTAEHVGLGRYGDPIDPLGDVKAMNELRRVLAPGGLLLFVVPTGRSRVVFNAHRCYSYQQVVDSFPGLVLEEFHYIPSDAISRGPIDNATAADVAKDTADGCGCYLFRKPAA
jgi:SAM-dependent methyltransferase